MFKKIIAHHDFITGKPKYNDSYSFSLRQQGRLTEDGQMVLPFDDEPILPLHLEDIEQNTQLIINGNDDGDAAITVINNDTTIRNLTITDYLNTPNRVGDVTYDIELGCLKTWNGMEWIVI